MINPKTNRPYTKSDLKRIENEKLFSDESLRNKSWVSCEICQRKFLQMSGQHLKKEHNITYSEYKIKFPNAIMISEEAFKKSSERMKGSNNPGYQHGGKFSPFSKNNPNTTEESRAAVKKKMAENRTPTTVIEYYLNKGMSEDEARSALIERQTTFSKEICIEKYGKEEGTKRWNDRQNKWMNTMANKTPEEWKDIHDRRVANGFRVSQMENEFVEAIRSRGVDVEDQFKIGLKFYDIRYGNKIIEFYGDFWHFHPEREEWNVNPFNNKTRQEKNEEDEAKNKLANDHGYEVKIVWERDYLENKEETIKKCLDYLKQ